MYDEDDATVGMLLDIDHLYGEHQGRLGPWVVSICVSAAPVLLYIYSGLYARIPIWLFAIFEAIFTIRVFMIVIGREKHRVAIYKKQLNDEYMGTADLLNVQIHPDGCLEYLNGKICYLVCCFNGTCEDSVGRSIQLRKLIDAMIDDYDYDTYLININESPALRNYYEQVSTFDKNQSAKNFINIVDHTMELTEDTSLVQCTLFAIKGFKSDWKDIRANIDTMINSRVARAYKSIYRIDDAKVINEFLNRDIDSIINISDLLRRKYANQQYDTSKVLAYDLPDDQEIIQGKAAVVKVVDDKAPKQSFHHKFEERV